MAVASAKVTELLRDLESAQKAERLAASKKLRDLSAETPGELYPHFDIFAGLLGSENNVLRWNAILTIANLAPADREDRIDEMLDVYLAPIRGPVMITAANTIKGAAIIGRAKQHLAPKIAGALMRVERAQFATPECRDVAIGHVLDALPKIVRWQVAGAFAAKHVNNPRPATAKKAARVSASSGSASKSRSRSS
ncbi:MAG TPA: hypothetical protein VKE70_12960 [Candidatus Solibacter sp.]|nr:hypothetical protein [Candidatus Solibacter sp.]